MNGGIGWGKMNQKNHPINLLLYLLKLYDEIKKEQTPAHHPSLLQDRHKSP